jgi:hypothetical protein
VYNNLAVAQEVLGELEEAQASYHRAVELGSADERIVHNQRRFERFWQDVVDLEEHDGSPPPGPGVDDVDVDVGKGKAVKVTVSLPVPPRLELGGVHTLLVASFHDNDTPLIDVNRELVRFLRGEFGKGTELEVLPVVPPPAIPEQSLEDLVANREFWQHLGREHGADIIVSGEVSFGRQDVSGFREVDVVSQSTGQKVRQTRFVEQERFDYEVEVIFMDGASGALLFRDRLQRATVYRGSQNDPISAFFELSESIAEDVLAIVKPRTREDVRIIFKS